MTITTPNPLAHIRFVLVGTTHSGNIGAVARAMKNMGLRQLHLVNPRQAPDAEAIARASGADDLLAAAQVHADLTAALAGCRRVIGSSARLRTIAWPMVTPREAAQHLLEEAHYGDVALVFGRECSGLSNAELARCHYLAHIPTAADFSSLNLAAAAQVFAYELYQTWQAQSGETPPKAARELATAEALEGFFAHLNQALIDIGFADPEQSKRLSRRLRRLFQRAEPDWTELNILRGILSAAQGRKSPGRFARQAASSERDT